MDFIIKKLNKEYLQNYISAFIDILKDEPYEYWSEENFLLELPKKFELSYVLEINGVLAAYIISSLKDGEIAYIHKFMTHRDYRSIGLGKIIFSVFQINCRHKSIKEIQLSVIKSNDKAVDFYSKIGFSKISERFDSKNKIMLLLLGKKIQ